jgi:site-specific DNA-methyltransferase (adenine-specific)
VNMTAGNQGQNLYGNGVNAGAFGDVVPGLGRWPANLIHDGSEEVVGLFPQNTSPAPRKTKRSPDAGTRNGYGTFAGQEEVVIGYGDSGSAARFFYCAKASKADRGGENTHPTVKPTELMRYLCRLVTPPGGVVLDPFMGSGSTGKAAALEGFRFIGIEREAEYLEIARGRISVPQQTQGSLL